MTDWKNRITGSGTEDPEQLLANPHNFRYHPKHQQDALAGVLNEIGWIQDVIVNTTTGHIIDGHLRVQLAMSRSERVPVKYVELSENEERIALAAIDPISALATQDQGLLDDLIEGIHSVGDMAANAFLQSLLSDDGPDFGGGQQEEARQGLQQRFLVPPFSVLDAKQGYWKDRKNLWLQLGIQSELGRGNEGDKTERGLTYAVSSQPPGVYEFKNKVEAQRGRKLTWQEFVEEFPEEITLTGTSIFDPVLTEISYSWFCPPGGAILDPFAGGSVRGLVAGFLGYNYTGIDLRGEQIQANRQQAFKILGAQTPGKPAADLPPTRIQEHDGIRVLRDDDVCGGTKRRALERVLAASPETTFVYATPAYGFAQIALAAAARATGKQAHIFVAGRRKKPHARTEAAARAGAVVHEVDARYLIATQKAARDFAEETGAHYIEFGLDNQDFIDAIAAVALETGETPTEVWTVAGSGVLTRALQQAWPDAEFHAVAIGKDPQVGRAKLYEAPEKFEDPAKQPPPFESCNNYDAKAWRFIKEHASEGALFWNVAGDVGTFDIMRQAQGEPRWIEGDSREVRKHAPGEYDMVFSCPPYADLEVYSDDPKDLSTLEYHEFIAAYTHIIGESCKMLKDNRFAVFVVGEVRDPKGRYRGFVQDTIAAFQAAGLHYYNEAVLLTNIGSNAMRAGGMFSSSRKLAKGHQNALVFAKGEPSLGDIKGLSKAVADHFKVHRTVFQAYDNVMVFCKGDPKLATETIGEVKTVDLEALQLAAMDSELNL